MAHGVYRLAKVVSPLSAKKPWRQLSDKYLRISTNNLYCQQVIHL